jgi:dihydroneopterin triphosphate diphosphatase
MPHMPRVVSDIVDIYVFRRLNARVQFLLLQRRPDVALPHTWQAFHSQVRVGDTTIETVIRAVKELCGLDVSDIYSADYVNQFYDEGRDALVLAPVFAVNVSPQAPIDLASDFRDAAWFDRDEATARLAFSGQRWAVRHIDEIMGMGEVEASIYRIELSTPQPEHEDGPPVDDWFDDSTLAELENDGSPAELESVGQAPDEDDGHDDKT